VGAFVAINAKGGDCWQIFNRQRMLIIDGKYNNEDGMSTGRMYRQATKVFWEDTAEKLYKSRRDSAKDCWQVIDGQDQSKIDGKIGTK
jgi:hypothetical protein